MNNWTSYTLEEVCVRIYSGGTPSTKHPEYWGGSLKWLSSGETSQRFIYDTEKRITEEGVKKSSTKLADEGCTVIATAGQGFTRGQTSYLMTSTYMNQSVIACKPDTNKINPLFLYYNLDDRYEEFRMLSDGTSTRGGLSGAIVKRMKINLPSLEEQGKIVSILRKIDRKIEVNVKINDNLTEQIQVLYKKYFDDCHCEKIPMSSLIEVRDGTHDSPKPKESGMSLITSKHLLPFGVDKSSANLISEEDYNKVNERSKVNTYDILLSMIGTVGMVSFIIENPVDFAIKNVGLFKTSDCLEMTYYIHCYLLSSSTKQLLEQLLAGSTQKYISLTELRKLPICMPSNKLLKHFNTSVEPYYNTIITNIKENKSLNQLRDLLLPKLMSGEIDVSAIDI